jgi:hypothetical protein
MRHLRKFNENFYQDELVYSLAYFNDKYGDPTIQTQKYSNSEMITLTWNIGVDLSTFEDAGKSLEKLQELAVDMDHILTVRDRYKDYNFYTSITSKLKLKIIPKEVNATDYSFIIGQDWREVKLNISEIERFLNTKDMTIANSIIEDNEGWEQSTVVITLNKPITNDIFSEFRRLFEDEYEKIDRNIYLRLRGSTTISVEPEDEKTYVTY